MCSNLDPPPEFGTPEYLVARTQTHDNKDAAPTQGQGAPTAALAPLAF
jgi:hypothetical protein